MEEKAWAISGFITFALLEIIAIISGFIIGKMPVLSLTKMMMLSLSITAVMGIVGALLMLLFSKIYKYLPFNNMLHKVFSYFAIIAIISSATKFDENSFAGIIFGIFIYFIGALVCTKTFNYFTRNCCLKKKAEWS